MILAVVCVLLALHSYVLFPVLMLWLGRGHLPPTPPNHTGHLPTVDILLAARNEAGVIERKVRSTFATTYPMHLVQLCVGSDESDDGTDEALLRLQGEYAGLRFKRFAPRGGKAAIINEFASQSTADILVLTDADTFFLPDTLDRLVAPFGDPRVGGVQAEVTSERDAGAVAGSEVAYNHWDLRIKRGEGRFGVVIGAIGACYALRRSAYSPVPKGFVSDDFYIFMAVLENGFRCDYEPRAKCLMPIDGDGAVQFRRKVRISTGNWQNLIRFWKLLLPWKGTVAFAFWSHKVLRWLTPLLLAGVLVGCAFEGWQGQWAWAYAAWLQVAGYAVCALLLSLPASIRDGLPGIVRAGLHFVHMNVALMVGLWRVLSGKANVTWQNRPPPAR